MRLNSEDYCADLMANFRSRVTCKWCKHPDEPVKPRAGLCGHCNRIRLALKKIQAKAEAYRERYGALNQRLKWALEFQQVKVRQAKREGLKYGRFFDETFTDTKLENEFRFISGKFTGKDLFYGLTGPLNSGFGLNQRRFIFYLLSLMSRQYLRKRR
jgi:hypothetical protein